MIKALKGFFTKSNSATKQGTIAVIKDLSNLLALTDDYSKLAKAGYMENVIGSTCIRRTAQAIADIPCKYKLNGEDLLYKDADKLVKSIIDSLKDPSTEMDKHLFYESVISDWYISGDAFIFPREDTIGRVTSLDYLRKSKVNIQTSSDDRVHKYLYHSGTKRIEFTRNSTRINNEPPIENGNLQGRFNLVILKTFNPINETEGLSMLTPCGLSIDGHNNALKWNAQVMANGGKPQGMVSIEDGGLEPEQMDALAEKIQQGTSGAKRGSWLVSNGKAKVEKFSLTAQEMDFIEGIVQRAIDICNALDYPPYLLGFTGATFSNQDEANIALYRNSAIPKFNRMFGAIASFFSRKYDINFEIIPDLEKIPAMASVFAEMNKSIIDQYKSNILQLDEAREKLNHEPLKGIHGEMFYSDIAKASFQNPVNVTGT
ncbi:MAG: phage portal protein [Lentisphaeraceae bacterium]|nr:phage portal protein [Lentisphaeraceae bacterium]